MDNVTWYHGSPHPMVVGEVVRPGVMERNFKQSPPQQVSLTSEPWNALRWAREAAKNLGVDTIYVYRVERSDLCNLGYMNHWVSTISARAWGNPYSAPRCARYWRTGTRVFVFGDIECRVHIAV